MKPKRTPVPPGWRKLKAGETVRRSDKTKSELGKFEPVPKYWQLTWPVCPREFFIRRLPGKAKKSNPKLK